ncbi:unnamed protein product [Parnassius mnemosyne]|uniref:Endonuclease/exonuclease/phosphatase domain-containing protein n=1 Tax=Parnassius mnemosyne TaxID=213953 RepID=A0AAV1LCT9_9NEOP
MPKRGQTLKNGARELIIKLQDYFERERQNGGPLLPVEQVQERVSQALGVSKRTILLYKERKDIVSLSVERTVEMACVELEHLIVVSVYRPPCATYDHFERIVEEVLLKLSKQNKSVVMCGDFNINFLETSSISIKFRSLFKSYNLVNLFLEPTRIAGPSATCIDNIFTDVKPLHKSIIQNLSSDHCGELVSLPYIHKKQKNKKVVFVPINEHRL